MDGIPVELGEKVDRFVRQELGASTRAAGAVFIILDASMLRWPTTAIGELACHGCGATIPFSRPIVLGVDNVATTTVLNCRQCGSKIGITDRRCTYGGGEGCHAIIADPLTDPAVGTAKPLTFVAVDVRDAAQALTASALTAAVSPRKRRGFTRDRAVSTGRTVSVAPLSWSMVRRVMIVIAFALPFMSGGGIAQKALALWTSLTTAASAPMPRKTVINSDQPSAKQNALLRAVPPSPPPTGLFSERFNARIGDSPTLFRAAWVRSDFFIHEPTP